MLILTPNPIKSARREMKITADELAERLNRITGGTITKVEISRWENSKHKPNQDTIFVIAKVLNKNPIQFFEAVQNHFIAWREIFKKEA